MKKPFDFEKNDRDYVDSACDTGKRKALIRRLMRMRRIHLLGLIVVFLMCVFAGYAMYISMRVPSALGAVMALYSLQLAEYYRVDTRIKMLKTIDRMESSEE